MLTRKKKVLSSGLVAVKTYLEWMIMGNVPQIQVLTDNLAMVVISLLVYKADLDLIGITDSVEKQFNAEIDCETKDHFLEAVKLNNDGHYEVWLTEADDIYTIPDNLSLAIKCMESTITKLLAKSMYKEYEDIFIGLMKEEIIEEILVVEVKSFGYYLPYHPVTKESSSTTPIGPVFDASAKLAQQPSLNQCLQCGSNLIEFISDILLHFREKNIGANY